VEAAADEHAALAAIVRESAQVIVFSVPAKGGPDLVRRLKGADCSGQAYLLAVFDSGPTGKDIQNIIAAGAHDFLRRPVLDADQRVPASSLAEGMVLVHDVRNEGGILLAPAGSRLTSTTAAKLAQMLGPRFTLEVASAA
jgi:hypothetical protein